MEQEAAKQGLSLAELSRHIGWNPNQLGNITRGTVPGLSLCLDIARHFDMKPDYVLYLAGHISEDELDAPEAIPAELLPTINRLTRFRGTPFFNTALKMIEGVIDQMSELFKEAA